MLYLENWPIQKIESSDGAYPTLLKKISDCPKTLYFRGNFLTGQEKCLAIVGARLASSYGKEIALSLAINSSRAGLTIVSGLARGIDSWAHQGALEANSPTIAVLGTGLDEQSFYPQENLKLAKTILEKGGCLISEYPAGTQGAHFTFPQRNRIISGLSLGVVVVEAKIKSGALLTAKWAKQQKRKIMAVPGPVTSASSQGCHWLIKQEALLVENYNDILAGLSLSANTLPNILDYQGQNNEEQQIINALKNKAMSIDGIIEITGLTSSAVSTALCSMETEGQVKNLGGNTYALSR
ncbi:MAG: DNA-processing protein DprA [Candidatus Gribaldobacteria bacterium]|nr:DNA-processing protein DprA [Candidatus Gribaldobacteria bacterium]